MLKLRLQFLVVLSICFFTNVYSKHIFLHGNTEYHFKTATENDKEYIALNDLLEPLKIKYIYNRLLHKISFVYKTHTVLLSPVSNAVCVDGKMFMYDKPLIYKKGAFYLEQNVVLNSILPVLSYDYIKDIIVIDPGHGGSGLEGEGATAEFNGQLLKEKDIVLKFSKYFGNFLIQKGFSIKYTREKDEAVSLKDRIDLANNNRARIFISLHVNSSVSDVAKGFEVYYLSEKASDSHSELVSMTENKVFKNEFLTIENDINKIVKSMFTSYRINESSNLALFISEKMSSKNNRGIKKAPFYVLAGTYMPSVLVELGFLSNQEDFNNLSSDDWLQKTASQLADAIDQYLKKTNRS